MRKQQAFTLLEILLVVGVAAVLLIGGLWAAIAIRESHNVGEIVRLSNMIRSEANRLRFEVAIADNQDIEPLLLAKRRIAHRFIDEDNNQLMSPYLTDTNAVNVFARAGSMTEVQITMPPAKVVELYSQFPVNRASDITEFRACGLTVTRTNSDTVGSPASMANACGSSKGIPENPNVFIEYAQQ